MSDLNLPPDEQADHSGPVADPDSFEGDGGDDGEEHVPQPGTVPPPD